MPAPAGSQQTFVNDLAKDTGLSPQVIQAWVQVEGAYAPGGTGGYNFLNIRESTTRSGVPLAGTTPKGFAQFHSAGQAAQETAWWINNMSNFKGIKSSASMSPESQLTAIAASPWDSGHYNGGKSLFAAYDSIVTSAGGGILSTLGKYGLNPLGSPTQIPSAVPGASTIGSIVSAPATLAEDTGKVLGFVFNPQDWLRVGYILAGGILTLGGLFVLARSVGAVQSAATIAFPEGTLAAQGAAKAGVSSSSPSRAAAPRTRTVTKKVYIMDEEENRRERVRRRAAAAQPSNDIPF